MEHQEYHTSELSAMGAGNTAAWEIPNEGWRWTPPPPAAPQTQQGQAESVAEFGHNGFVVSGTGNAQIGSHDRHLATVAHADTHAQMTSSTGQGASMNQHDTAAPMSRIPTVPDWGAFLFEDSAADGTLPRGDGYASPQSIPHMNDGSFLQALPAFPSYPTASTALPTATTFPLHGALFDSSVPRISTTTHIGTQTHPFVYHESQRPAVSAAAAATGGGTGSQGVNVQWEPLSVNGVRVLYAVHGYYVVVDPSDLPFPSPAHAGGSRPGFFVTTSVPVDPRSVLCARDTAAFFIGAEHGGSQHAAPNSSTPRQTRPLLARRRRHGSQTTGRQTTSDYHGSGQGSAARHASG